jgi:hypothetical protein
MWPLSGRAGAWSDATRHATWRSHCPQVSSGPRAVRTCHAATAATRQSADMKARARARERRGARAGGRRAVGRSARTIGRLHAEFRSCSTATSSMASTSAATTGIRGAESRKPSCNGVRSRDRSEKEIMKNPSRFGAGFLGRTSTRTLAPQYQFGGVATYGRAAGVPTVGPLGPPTARGPTDRSRPTRAQP